jgi:peptide/nickel transport system substrate-binding protein
VRRPFRALCVGVLAVALAAAGCSKNTGTSSNSNQDKTTTQTATLAKNSDGPAPEVSGAKKGGTITAYQTGDFEHLDPAQNYVTDAQVTGILIYRTLTAFRENGDGKLEVVGDLATNTGESSNGGKTWTFHLKDGLKYEDGSPVTSKDIAYGIARSFSPDLPNGPHYWQAWLAGDADYNAKYKGPYNGGSVLPPNTETPDDKTIVFNFPKPQADIPLAGALPTTAPVPQSKDTKIKYDNRPFSSGPYKIETYTRSQKLVLVKNPNWDPKTDPFRHQYPDKFIVDFTKTNEQINQQLIADQGTDQTAMAYQPNGVPPDLLPQVNSNPAVKKRTLDGNTQFVWYLDINNQKITDLKVRQALNYAIDRQNLLKVWGPGSPGTTILSPTVSGYHQYNAYDGGPNGDVNKAKELLGGKRVKLSYAFRNTARNQKVAAFYKTSLAKAGFDLTIQPIDPDQFYTQIGKKDNPWDIYMYGWGSDYPSSSTVIPPLFDGRNIVAEGNNNDAYLNAEDVNKKIDEVYAMTDPSKAATAWADLDQYIMKTHAPVVPVI